MKRYLVGFYTGSEHGFYQEIEADRFDIVTQGNESLLAFYRGKELVFLFHEWVYMCVKEKIEEGEHCQRCGKPYRTVYDVPDELWATVTDKSDGSGLYCISCFDEMAREKGIVLRWNATLMEE